MKKPLKQIAFVLAPLFVLAACTADTVENAALSSAKSWCRNSPQYCSVHDQTP
ncbi:MAG TPA: hypothetical protein VN809_15625 [Telmatospirillum sp.]|nr:hypothetical protein [Telmatospirillum sp.]